MAYVSPFVLEGTGKTPFKGRWWCAVQLWVAGTSGGSCLAALASWEFGLVLCASGKTGLKLLLSVLSRYNHLNPCSAFDRFVLQR